MFHRGELLREISPRNFRAGFVLKLRKRREWDSRERLAEYGINKNISSLFLSSPPFSFFLSSFFFFFFIFELYRHPS